ncbi:MAG: PolC-type DNA polymerase III [Bacilli bacterium]|nr:PolC-type DNA polymerase III [Bacilli bacterium]
MEANIEKLLKKINLEQENFVYFNDAKLIKIVGNKEKTNYSFLIEVEHILPLEIYLKIKELLKQEFKTINNIDLIIKCNNINASKISEYYRYLIKEYAKQSPLLEMFQNLKLELSEQDLIIEVNNKAEDIKFKSIVDNLKKDFSNMGFNINIKTNVNNIKSREIIEEINNELKVVIKEKKIVEEIKEEKPKFKYKGEYTPKPLIQDTSDENIVMGSKIEEKPERIDTISLPKGSVVIEAYIFGKEVRDTKSGLKIVSLKLTDFTDSIYGTIFIRNEEEFKIIDNKLKINNWYKMKAKIKDKDQYNQDLSLTINDITIIKKEVEEIIDDAPIKRVELHAHTMMSQMDGITKLDLNKHTIELVDKTIKMGYKAVAITDHNGCQAFPIAFESVTKYNKKQENDENKFKAIYGAELTLIDDDIKIVVRPNDSKLLENTYVVFDLETTGFNAGGGDSIIEIGAVKICNGEIIDRFDQLIDPERPLPAKITEVTNITDDMLKNQPKEKEAVIDFIKWSGSLPMVAHNAKFDVSFLEMAYKKYDLGEFTNTVIDTLELSRTLDNGYARHSLSALVKRYGVAFDEDAHHRADYDSEGTALVFHKMLKKLDSNNFELISDLDKLVSKDEIHKYGRAYHFNLLALNKVGLKNLFKIISLANTKYLYKTPRILRSEVEKLREGLFIGSGCYESEVFTEARSKSEEELVNIINFYDYVEVQPLDVYDHLLQMGDFGNVEELKEHIKKIIRTTKESGKIIVATGDVHHFTKEDKIYREIIVNQKVPGGGRHPLAKTAITKIPSQHFRTTREMLNDFEFIGEKLAYEIVVENTNKIADMVNVLEVIIDTGGSPFSPIIENSAQITEDMVRNKAKNWYGDPLPKLIQDRVDHELKGIIGAKYDVIYLIAQKLVKKSNDDGYLVGSRGSVGSSFVATMMGITEVNPLPAHYRCPNCKHSIFDDEKGNPLGAEYSSGVDLPDMNCPKCNTKMIKDGQDMPFATFLGFNADKVPDIDLNFSDLNQAETHEYTKVLFGEDNVYRAGTIGTVAEKTAFGFVKGYCEDKNLVMRTAEIERLSMGCTGVKRTTGQHPGGIVVIPGYMDVFDFTPFQYPAEDVNAAWRTTHFDYHAIQDDVLKLDILGHTDPTQLRMIQDITKIDVTTVPLDDKETMGIFLSPKPLGVSKEQIMCETGTLGVPEFGTPFTIGMLVDTKPKSFSELIKISGLSHGTDVWLGNAQELIKNNIVPFKEVIGCRDDIMVYLMYNGLEPITAFKIMEFVRKGQASKNPTLWTEYSDIMQKAGIEKWFIDSCQKIKYMFPKAHAAAYVMSAFRIAYFKVHYPAVYYATYFSTRFNDFDIDCMIKGYDAIKNRMIEINNKGYDVTNKEASILETLKLSLEATARGFKFGNIDILKSDAKNFIIADDNITLIPPFRSIDGLGESVAQNIVEERQKRPFLSIEDFAKRAKVSQTLIEKLRMMNVFEGMDESSQLSLF